MKRRNFSKGIGEYIANLPRWGKVIWTIVLGYMVARVIHFLW
ncbi:hypothetical protein [Brevibacillus laterosporus]|nr:hypothetical protein [Brevibacillus laterosporus]